MKPMNSTDHPRDSTDHRRGSTDSTDRRRDGADHLGNGSDQLRDGAGGSLDVLGMDAASEAVYRRLLAFPGEGRQRLPERLGLTDRTVGVALGGCVRWVSSARRPSPRTACTPSAPGWAWTSCSPARRPNWAPASSGCARREPRRPG